jgi:large conductance mechanosensitive channel
MEKYTCSVCSYTYDPAKGDSENGIAPGTPFENLPDFWTCPVCGASKKSLFLKAKRVAMFEDFKEFAMRGNVVDMAVGIVIGAAFGTIVKSFVDDVLMPPIGLLLGNVDFSNLFLTLKEGSKAASPYASLAAAKAAGAVTLNLGVFINTVISFIFIAFAVFLVIKGFNRMKREKEVPPAETTTRECPFCFTTLPIQASRCPYCTSQLTAA